MKEITLNSKLISNTFSSFTTLCCTFRRARAGRSDDAVISKVNGRERVASKLLKIEKVHLSAGFHAAKIGMPPVATFQTPSRVLKSDSILYVPSDEWQEGPAGSGERGSIFSCWDCFGCGGRFGTGRVGQDSDSGAVGDDDKWASFTCLDFLDIFSSCVVYGFVFLLSATLFSFLWAEILESVHGIFATFC